MPEARERIELSFSDLQSTTLPFMLSSFDETIQYCNNILVLEDIDLLQGQYPKLESF